jgi:hypothetical protein
MHVINKTMLRAVLLAAAFTATSLAGPPIACKWVAVPGTVFETLSSLRDTAMAADDSPMAKAEALKRLERLREEAKPNDALSLLKAGFWATTMRDIGITNDPTGPDLIAKAAALRPNEPEYQFFAALAYIHNDKARFRQHWSRAQTLSKPGSATARNMKIVQEIYAELVD